VSLLSLLIVEMGRLPYPSQALGLGANPIRAQPSYGCATTADSLEALAWLCFCRPPPRCRNAPCSPSRSPTPVFSFARGDDQATDRESRRSEGGLGCDLCRFDWPGNDHCLVHRPGISSRGAPGPLPATGGDPMRKPDIADYRPARSRRGVPAIRGPSSSCAGLPMMPSIPGTSGAPKR
jgi:hypothetical protein